jgi:hypothetical protein
VYERTSMLSVIDGTEAEQGILRPIGKITYIITVNFVRMYILDRIDPTRAGFSYPTKQ